MTPFSADVAANAQWAPIRHTSSYLSTFPHHFKYFTSRRNCHGACGNGTGDARLSCRRGGRLQGSRHHASSALQRGDVRVFSRLIGSGLGTGGATALSLAVGTAAWRRDRQVPSRVGGCVCQQRFEGAAGSEWALPPGGRSIALGHKLEQRLDALSTQFPAFLRAPSERLSSGRRWTCRTVGETPVQFGAPVETRESRRLRHDSWSSDVGRKRPSVGTSRRVVGP